MNWILLIIGITLIYLSDVITGGIRVINRKLEWLEMERDCKKFQSMTDEEKEKDKESRRYNSTEEMVNKLREDDSIIDKFFNKHDKLRYLRAILWYRLLDHPEDLHLWIKTKYQRAKRGWADSDAWGLYYYLITVIIGGLEHIKKHKQGVPSGFVVENDDDDLTKSSANWGKALDCMIKTFKTASKIEDKYWVYQYSEEYSVKIANESKKMNKKMREKSLDLWDEDALHVMTKAECQEYEKGWRLFQRHFFNLWD